MNVLSALRSVSQKCLNVPVCSSLASFASVIQEYILRAAGCWVLSAILWDMAEKKVKSLSYNLWIDLEVQTTKLKKYFLYVLRAFRHC